ARDAMPGGGQLMLHAKNSRIEEAQARRHPAAKPGPCVVITVGDTGMGIASEMLEEIFEPFFTTKEPGKGTGLGLATVRGILKNHGGFVEVQSELGRGTQFEVWIPAIEKKTAQPGEEKQAEMPVGCGELILGVSGLDSETGFRIGPGGVQAFLTKPYTAQELLLKLKAVLRGEAVLRS